MLGRSLRQMPSMRVGQPDGPTLTPTLTLALALTLTLTLTLTTDPDPDPDPHLNKAQEATLGRGRQRLECVSHG